MINMPNSRKGCRAYRKGFICVNIYVGLDYPVIDTTDIGVEETVYKLLEILKNMKIHGYFK
jgi:hypothetical protein